MLFILEANFKYCMTRSELITRRMKLILLKSVEFCYCLLRWDFAHKVLIIHVTKKTY